MAVQYGVWEYGSMALPGRTAGTGHGGTDSSAVAASGRRPQVDGPVATRQHIRPERLRTPIANERTSWRANSAPAVLLSALVPCRSTRSRPRALPPVRGPDRGDERPPLPCALPAPARSGKDWESVFGSPGITVNPAIAGPHSILKDPKRSENRWQNLKWLADPLAERACGGSH